METNRLAISSFLDEDKQDQPSSQLIKNIREYLTMLDLIQVYNDPTVRQDDKISEAKDSCFIKKIYGSDISLATSCRSWFKEKLNLSERCLAEIDELKGCNLFIFLFDTHDDLHQATEFLSEKKEDLRPVPIVFTVADFNPLLINTSGGLRLGGLLAMVHTLPPGVYIDPYVTKKEN